MKSLCISLLIVAMGLPIARAAAAETVSPSYDPVELVRTLRAVQDQMVLGNRGAYAAHRKVMATVSDQLLKTPPDSWRDAAYLRAGILFTLSGGDTRVARQVLGLSDLPAEEERLLKGALAYAESRNTEASELLSGIDVFALDTSIAGYVALAQGTIHAKDEPKRAISRLEAARLLSPGTLVEEAALRREIMLLAGTEDFDRFETLSGRYLRRYRKSIYADAFRRQLAVELAGMKVWNDPQRLAKLDKMVDGLDAGEKQDLYLAMAQAGILKGQVGLTRFAAQRASGAHAGVSRADVSNASASEAEGVTAAPQAQVYEAAALIVTDKYDSGLEQLQKVDRAALTPQDAELLDAALKIAGQIRQQPEPGLAMPASPPGESSSVRERDLAAAGARVVKLAQGTMAKVDGMLNTRSR